jgi:hypothetical protein
MRSWIISALTLGSIAAACAKAPDDDGAVVGSDATQKPTASSSTTPPPRDAGTTPTKDTGTPIVQPDTGTPVIVDASPVVPDTGSPTTKPMCDPAQKNAWDFLAIAATETPCAMCGPMTCCWSVNLGIAKKEVCLPTL